MSVQEQVQSGALSQEQYVEGVQKLHKVYTGLLKKDMLTGDDAMDPCHRGRADRGWRPGVVL